MSDLIKFLLKTTKKILKNYYTYVILLILLATYFTMTPFLYHTFQTPPNRIYVGAEHDINTYFKYLKVTLDGQNLSFQDFKNLLSKSPLDEKYYLLKGRIDSLFALSHFSSYHFGRLKLSFLFFLFLYLILSYIFLSRPTRLVIFAFIFIIFNLSIYPHLVFFRLLIVVLLLLLLKTLKRLKIPLKTPFAVKKSHALIAIAVLIFISFRLNNLYIQKVKSQFGSGKMLSPLIYPSKDFYEGIGYLRDNVSANEKVICLSRCSILTEVFAGIPTALGLPKNNEKYKEEEIKLAYDIQNIFDLKDRLKALQEGGVVYWFIGPEEKPLIGPDFGRLKPTEVFKNKEVTIYKLP